VWRGRRIPPTPDRVRLGRWLFFDRRLSADGSVSCATCHRPDYACSQPTPVATGIGGHRGRRKVLPIINLAMAARPANFKRQPQAAFWWDERAPSLERQALEPIANPIEMGSSHASMVATVARTRGYAPCFADAFGHTRITKERIASAIADCQRASERQRAVRPVADGTQRASHFRYGEARLPAVPRQGGLRALP
jgi:cytochrome c peroxidase